MSLISKEYLYRYEERSYSNASISDYEESYYITTHLEEYKYEIVKKTKCGYYIKSQYGFLSKNSAKEFSYKDLKWVSASSKKRYAYPSKREALQGYLKRKERHKSILQAKIDRIESGISQAEHLLYRQKERGLILKRLERAESIRGIKKVLLNSQDYKQLSLEIESSFEQVPSRLILSGFLTEVIQDLLLPLSVVIDNRGNKYNLTNLELIGELV